MAASAGAAAGLPVSGGNATLTEADVSMPQDSIADYEVLAGSPIVGFLSDGELSYLCDLEECDSKDKLRT